jgi:hypothetical protein
LAGAGAATLAGVFFTLAIVLLPYIKPAYH